jgi:hypothetical protein
VSISRESLEQMIAEDEYGLLELREGRPLLTPDQRLAARFADITEFVRREGRPPSRDSQDMSEAQLAMRLRAITGNDEQRAALASVDELGLLREPEPPSTVAEALASDDMGLLDDPGSDIFAIRNVPRKSTAPDRIAQRTVCEDFAAFAQLFVQCHAELRSGVRRLVTFRREQQIRPGTYYVLKGLLVYVADSSEKVREHGRINARLRCIFENGTEADMLLRSLSSQLYRFGKRVTEPEPIALAPMTLAAGTPMATVYVLRSLSDDPLVRYMPDLHKIGATRQAVAARIAGADRQTTFLAAPVRLVEEFSVPVGAERMVEAMLHSIFAVVRLDAWFERSGAHVADANEWFAVPLEAIEDAVSLIEAETIGEYEYDPESRRMRLRHGSV